MIVIRWSRRALIVFIAAYLLGLAVPALTDRQEVVAPAFWLCVFGAVGAAGASIAALTAQLTLGLRRRKEGERAHG